MDGLVVCALAGARRGRGFEPRFVCPSRGPPVRPPPPPLSAARSTIGTTGAMGGVSRPHSFSFIVYTVHPCFFSPVSQCPLWGSKRQHTRHITPAAARPATGTALRRRNRISSSYSSSAHLLKGIRTPVFRAAAGCTAAAVHGPKAYIMHHSTHEGNV